MSKTNIKQATYFHWLMLNMTHQQSFYQFYHNHVTSRWTNKGIQWYNSKSISIIKTKDDISNDENKIIFSIICTHKRYKPKPVYIGIFVSPITIFQSNISTECPKLSWTLIAVRATYIKYHIVRYMYLLSNQPPHS